MNSMKDQQPSRSSSTTQTSFIPRLRRSQSLRENGEHPILAPFNEEIKDFKLTIPSRRHSITSRVPVPKVGQKQYGSMELQVRSRSSSIGDPRNGQEYSTPLTPDEENSSVKSFGSCATFMSCDITPRAAFSKSSSYGVNCTYPEKKYVLHCQRKYESPEEYLTPTQRKNRQIRQLKAALVRATRACEVKDVEIERLYAEIERLRRTQLQKSVTGFENISTPTETSILSITEDIKKSEMVIQVNSNDRKSPHCEDSGVISDVGSSSPPVISSCSSHQKSFESGADCNACKYSEDEDKIKEMHVHFNIGNTEPHHSVAGSSLSDSSSEISDLSGQNSNVENEELSHDSCLTQDICKTKEQLETSPVTSGNDNLDVFGCTKILNSSNQDTELDRSLREAGGQNMHLKISKMYQTNSPSNEKITHCSRNRNLVIFEEDAFDDYQKELEELKAQHSIERQELREKYNDRIENLLHNLSEINARYLELRPAYEKALDQIRYFESQVVELKKEMAAQEEWHSQMYLKMYRKGQEAAKFEHADEVLEFAQRAPKRVSVPELLQQLRQTKQELEQTKELYRCELYRRATTGSPHHQAEYTLKFLKDAVYYFLVDKDNKNHLRAIESILGFSEKEKETVAKVLKHRRI
ncbi:uncharacterized protein LOC106457298 [Limulus polyphemus]|uniref:Uncharacterized protein LOC106457298 n=1 Tax=Limulus polyphemus TaxID=6850 RepID=A0ABM1S5G6_LIMPO|nr:uncharacterized protein LOC106457298 [Limulus polyphemus]XP_022238871.1 uncharacterized protein LOC106457298 [Limulus polyphemus]